MGYMQNVVWEMMVIMANKSFRLNSNWAIENREKAQNLKLILTWRIPPLHWC